MIKKLKRIGIYTLTIFISLFAYPNPIFAMSLTPKAEMVVLTAKVLVPIFIILVILVGIITLIIYLFEKHHKKNLKKEIKPFIFMNFVIIFSVIILNIFLSLTIRSLLKIPSSDFRTTDSVIPKSELIHNLISLSIPTLSLIPPIILTTIYQHRNIKSKTKYAYWGIYALTVVGLIISLILIFVFND